MSDLKYLNRVELLDAKKMCEYKLTTLQSQVNGQCERLKWIEKYLVKKTPVEMTLEQIECKLGHKVIIK